MAKDPSNTKVDKAGQTLRRHHLGVPQPVDLVAEAEKTVEDFRSRFLQPYLAVRESLQTIADSRYPGCSVTGRPKRYERIIEKMVRQPKHRLSQMQDVGGARLVLPPRPAGVETLANLAAVANAVREAWPETRAVDDYVQEPRNSGYRAIHVVVVHGEEQVEIQLRTYRQHLWAEVSESMSRSQRARLDLGEGPDHVLRALRQASDVLAGLDRGTPLSELVTEHGWGALGAVLLEFFNDYPRGKR